MSHIEDRIALRELIDLFAIYGDKKQMTEQALLFSDTAIVELYFNGELTSTLKGHLEIEETFTSFIKAFECAYHFNGQQVLTINNETATGIVYCTVTLISIEEGKRIKTTVGMHYEDVYTKVNDRWFIDKRKSMFDWQDKNELGS